MASYLYRRKKPITDGWLKPCCCMDVRPGRSLSRMKSPWMGYTPECWEPLWMSPGRITPEILNSMGSSRDYQTLSDNGAWGLLATVWDIQSSLPVNSSSGNPPMEGSLEAGHRQCTSIHWRGTLAWTALLRYERSWRTGNSGGLQSRIPESALLSYSSRVRVSEL